MESFEVSLYREVIDKDKRGASGKSKFLFKVFTKETSDYKKFFSETFIKICFMTRNIYELLNNKKTISHQKLQISILKDLLKKTHQVF